MEGKNSKDYVADFLEKFGVESSGNFSCSAVYCERAIAMSNSIFRKEISQFLFSIKKIDDENIVIATNESEKFSYQNASFVYSIKENVFAIYGDKKRRRDIVIFYYVLNNIRKL